MEYAENTKITLRSRLSNNTRAATAEYTKKQNTQKTQNTQKKNIYFQLSTKYERPNQHTE